MDAMFRVRAPAHGSVVAEQEVSKTSTTLENRKYGGAEKAARARRNDVKLRNEATRSEESIKGENQYVSDVFGLNCEHRGAAARAKQCHGWKRW